MDFKTHLKKYLNEEQINNLLSSINNAPVRALLLNIYKMREEDLLNEYPFLQRHPIVKNGFIYNPNEHELGKSIHHFLGCFYIQEPSAMVPAYLLNANSTDYVLDICAAPGGKCVQSSLLMENQGLLVANDLSHQRTNALLENVERMGLGNVVITNTDFKNHYKFYKNYFSKISNP
jgi:16S rRNA C967 or C1407 C5-methylase (RsmB/RsmF family)